MDLLCHMDNSAQRNLPAFELVAFLRTLILERLSSLRANMLPLSGSEKRNFCMCIIKSILILCALLWTGSVTAASTVNIALGQPVFVSSVERSSLAPPNAVDENTSTRWSTVFSSPQWIYVDLGTTYIIEHVVLNWEVAYGKAYKIQVSPDAVNWTDVFSETNSDGGIDDINFAATSARYVRMYGTVRGTQYGFSLWELEIYAADPLAAGPLSPILPGFDTVSDVLWDETAVRKVLHAFAYGGQATDAQIKLWADMSPRAAIVQMLSFDQHNLLLSPVGPNDTDRLDTKDGTLRGLAQFWSSSHPNNRIYVRDRPLYSLVRYKNPVWIRAATSRGLNPFRQKIGLWETNYHMAVNQLAGPTSEQIIRYYDDIMNALEQGLPYQDVMTVAAQSAAILRQYGQNYFVNGVCHCNEDFAREYYQLFLGILGDYDPYLHETITIKNTAKALTGTTILRNSKGDYTDATILRPEYHYPGSLNMLNVEIGGASSPERFKQLAPYAIIHEESLDNLPVMIIQGLADDNLTDEKIWRIRSAWRSMHEKSLLDFLRAYAVSEIFHNENRVKYLTSVDRHLMIASNMLLNNEENYLDLYGGGPYGPNSFEEEGVVVFQPEHNVFGAQTGIEASDSMDIFRNNYNRFTGYPSLWYRRTSINKYGRIWIKDWASVVPRRSESYQVKFVAEWLWNRFVGDGLKNFGELERAHVYALLATDKDIGYLRDPSGPGRVLSADDFIVDPNLAALVQDLAGSEMALDSSGATERAISNRRIGTAITFILATPYIFAQEGR